MRRSTYKLVLLMLLLVAAACEQEANENTPATAMPATPVAETAVSATTAPASNERVQITSPDGEIIVKFSLQEGVPYYAVDVSGSLLSIPRGLVSSSKRASRLTKSCAHATDHANGR